MKRYSRLATLSKPRAQFLCLCTVMAAFLASISPLASAQVRETPPQVMNGSAQVMGHYAGSGLRLTIGLKPPHMDQEEQFLQALQTKGSPEFHHFLTAEEWSKRFDPSAEDEQAVVDWAKSQGLNVSHRFPNRLLVDVEASVATIEKAFNLTINNYQLQGKSFFSNDRDPEIPSSLAGIIQSVGGMNSLQVMRPANKNLSEPAFPDYTPGLPKSKGAFGAGAGSRSKLAAAMKVSEAKRNVGPITLNHYDPTDMYSSQAYDTNALYHLGHCCNPIGNPGVTPPQTTIAIATAGSQLISDFQGFQNQYPYLAWHVQEFYIDGTPSCCDGEGTMDFEWATVMANSFGAAADTAMVYMYDGVDARFSTFEDIYNHMLNDGLARNFSTSWGCEEYVCFDSSDILTTHGIFNSMVGQGWSMAAATGDQGSVAGCNTTNAAVQYPGSDPNLVASGGATISLSSGPLFNYEVGWSGGPSGCTSNDGGSTGGYSAAFSTPSYQTFLSLGTRGLPDIALNADWYYTPQNIYFNGSLQGNGGTSIVAPEMGGFFANANSYLLSLGNICGGGSSPCSPFGNPNYAIYGATQYGTGSRFPFYDITSGCNSNDYTSFYGLPYYCARAGWDEVTGWGSINMLQLAWTINWFHAAAFGAPSVSFFGPTINTWYNSNQVVSWSVIDNSNGHPGTGIAGFTQGWDSIPPETSFVATPGTGDSFYYGPEFANATSGCLDLTGGVSCEGGVSQGWHYAHVRAWNNMGQPSGDVTYGPVGYDTVPPSSTDKLSGTFNGSVFTTPVTVTLTASDASPGSGVAHIYWALGTNPFVAYTGPFKITTTGKHALHFYSSDFAGNSGTTKNVAVPIEAATTTTLTSGTNPSSYRQAVTFKAVVSGSFGATPTGSVTFKNGGVAIGSSALSGGVATLSFAGLTVGSHSITATYSGSPKNLVSTSSALTQTVNKANTTTKLASSLNPSVHGQAVTFTATVTGAFGGSPAGTVTFRNGTSVMGTGTVNTSTHKATFTTSSLSTGTHSITAAYGGSTAYRTSTSAALSQKVNP